MVTTMQEFVQAMRFMEHKAQYYLESDKVKPSNLPTHTGWQVTEKYDGVYGNIVCIREPNKALNTVRVFSRDGKLLSNTQWTEMLFASVPPGVYMAEFCIAGGVFEDASRFYNPNVVNQLDLADGQYCTCHLFDHVTIDEYVTGKSQRGFTNRYAFLFSIYFEDSTIRNSINVSIATKYTLDIFDFALIAADHLISKGAEGAIVVAGNQLWQRGKRDENAIKVVAYKYFDLRILGIKQGKGKHAAVVGALYVKWCPYGDANNPPVKVPVDGKISYEMRRSWYVSHFMTGNFEGKIAKVKCKGFTNKGMMRQPKLIEVRWDKTEADM